MGVAPPVNRALRLVVSERSHVAEVRRRALELARQADWSAERQSDLGIVTTELAQNIVRHARRGDVVLGVSHCDGRATIDVAAVDSGSGIGEVDRALRDGYSTAGTAGNGLGAVCRLSQEFDLYTRQAWGTAVFARMDDRRGPMPNDGWLEIAGYAIARPGESFCGDAWAWRDHGRHAEVLVADGLGHGPDAATASRAAVEAFMNSSLPLGQQLAPMHDALRRTRGAAVGMARIQRREERLLHLSAGNIAAGVVADQAISHLVARHGTVGLATPRADPVQYNLALRSCLVMHSDGLSTRWQPGSYPGLWRRHCGLIAAVLLRQESRGGDDATVVVARRREQAELPTREEIHVPE